LSSPPPRLLLIVADPLLAGAVADHLGAAMTVTRAADLADAQARAGDHDILVLDEGVGTADSGAEPPCRTLRRAGVAAPLVLLAAASLGEPDPDADLVIAKPVRLSALSARLTELLARRPAADLTVGPWRLDPDRRLLSDPRGRAVRLTDKEVAILRRLARAKGEVVARETLLAEIWGYSAAIDTHTLETHVYRLRRKLRPDTAAADLLCTEPGGYRLAV
jgi:DNA-binding response OmpR family regulator